MVINTKFFTIVILIFSSACSSLHQKNEFNILGVENTGTDNGEGKFCSNFYLEKNEAQFFFNRAKIISSKQLHDSYSFLPCFVRGKGQLKKLECTWEVRAGGTGEITCGEKVYLYGCSDCQDILK